MTNHKFRATFGDTFILLGEKIFNLLQSCVVKFVAGRALQSKFQVALNKHQEVGLGSKMLKTYYMAVHSMNFQVFWTDLNQKRAAQIASEFTPTLLIFSGVTTFSA